MKYFCETCVRMAVAVLPRSVRVQKLTDHPDRVTACQLPDGCIVNFSFSRRLLSATPFPDRQLGLALLGLVYEWKVYPTMFKLRVVLGQAKPSTFAKSDCRLQTQRNVSLIVLD